MTILREVLYYTTRDGVLSRHGVYRELIAQVTQLESSVKALVDKKWRRVF